MAFSSKSLSKTDVNDRFIVPVEWNQENWPGIAGKIAIKVRQQITQSSEQRYVFVVAPRTDGSRSPVFLSSGRDEIRGRDEFKGWDEFVGWKAFVDNNKLDENNVENYVVRFGKKSSQDDHFTIIIEYKLF